MKARSVLTLQLQKTCVRLGKDTVIYRLRLMFATRSLNSRFVKFCAIPFRKATNEMTSLVSYC